MFAGQSESHLVADGSGVVAGVEPGHEDAAGAAPKAWEFLTVPDVDTVFAANDPMALGALDVLKEAGPRTPEDVAAAGFGDISVSRTDTPWLTNVRQPCTRRSEGLPADQGVLLAGTDAGRPPAVGARDPVGTGGGEHRDEKHREPGRPFLEVVVRKGMAVLAACRPARQLLSHGLESEE